MNLEKLLEVWGASLDQRYLYHLSPYWSLGFLLR